MYKCGRPCVQGVFCLETEHEARRTGWRFATDVSESGSWWVCERERCYLDVRMPAVDYEVGRVVDDEDGGEERGQEMAKNEVVLAI